VPGHDDATPRILARAFMSTEPGTEPSAEQSLRRSLAIRVGVALAALVVVAALAVSFSGRSERPTAAQPAPAGVQPARPAVPAPDATVKEPSPAGGPAQNLVEAPSTAKPGEPPVPAQTAPAAPTQTVPAAAGDTSAPPSAAAASQSRQPAADPAAARPTQEEANAEPAAPAPPLFAGLAPPPGGKPPRGPHLQAGVFLQPANAQAFKSKLEAQGLPVYVESRVHVGPFRDRKEAERVRERLNELGLATVLVAQ
jgi:DedD protein